MTIFLLFFWFQLDVVQPSCIVIISGWNLVTTFHITIVSILRWVSSKVIVLTFWCSYFYLLISLCNSIYALLQHFYLLSGRNMRKKDWLVLKIARLWKTPPKNNRHPSLLGDHGVLPWISGLEQRLCHSWLQKVYVNIRSSAGSGIPRSVSSAEYLSSSLSNYPRRLCASCLWSRSVVGCCLPGFWCQ